MFVLVDTRYNNIYTNYAYLLTVQEKAVIPRLGEKCAVLHDLLRSDTHGQVEINRVFCHVAVYSRMIQFFSPKI
jgi:hypothetical protein